MAATLRRKLLALGLLAVQAVAFTGSVVQAPHVRVNAAAPRTPIGRMRDPSTHVPRMAVLTEASKPEGLELVPGPLKAAEIIDAWTQDAAAVAEVVKNVDGQVNMVVGEARAILGRMREGLAGGGPAPEHLFALVEAGAGAGGVRAVAAVTLRNLVQFDHDGEDDTARMGVADIVDIVARPAVDLRQQQDATEQLIGKIKAWASTNDRSVLIPRSASNRAYFESLGLNLDDPMWFLIPRSSVPTTPEFQLVTLHF